MKRLNNLYEKIYSIENLILADRKARKGKLSQRGIIIHDKNKEANILMLHEMLKNKTYKTSSYSTFKIYEKKEREIFRLQIGIGEIKHVVFTGSGALMATIQQIPKDSFPFATKIIKENDRYEFT